MKTILFILDMASAICFAVMIFRIMQLNKEYDELTNEQLNGINRFYQLKDVEDLVRCSVWLAVFFLGMFLFFLAIYKVNY